MSKLENFMLLSGWAILALTNTALIVMACLTHGS